MEIDKKISLFKKVIPSLINTSYLEVGVWKGQLAQQVLTEIKPEYMMLVDPWLVSQVNLQSWYSIDKITQAEMDNIYLNVEKMFYDYKNVEIIRSPLYPAYINLLKNTDIKFDLVYIDGDHSYYSVYADLIVASKLCVPHQSIIICDDYRKDKWWEDDVIDAVGNFCKRYGFSREVVDDQAVIYI